VPIPAREDEVETVRRYHVWGRVQGVGFRAFVWHEARIIGVDGWVRNRLDGTVEVLASATVENHELLRAALERGPRLSSVNRIEIADEPGEYGLQHGFEIWNDA